MELGDVCNYSISLFALTTRKLKAKHESGNVQGPTEYFVYSLHPKFILFYFSTLTSFLPQLAHFRLCDAVIMHVFSKPLLE